MVRVTDDDEMVGRTFPTAASPRRTSLTLLLGLVAAAVESAMTATLSDPVASAKGMRNRLLRRI